MTKRDIAVTIADEMKITQRQATEIVQLVLSSIVDALSSDGRIEIRNFGVFEVRNRVARRVRNPLTGEIVHVPSKLVVAFKPGREMHEAVSR